MADLSQAIWRKARRSSHNGGCVEIAANLPGVAAVRDSKRPEVGVHVVPRAVFAEFLADVKGGRYDLLTGRNWRQEASRMGTAIGRPPVRVGLSHRPGRESSGLLADGGCARCGRLTAMSRSLA